MEPAWVTIALSIAGSLVGGLVTGLCAYFGLRTWVARLEEKHKALASRVEEDRELARQAKEIHDKRLAAHELEIGRLNWAKGRL
jgi:hypothetical protein